MAIPDNLRFALICPPRKLEADKTKETALIFDKFVFYFADYDRRQGMWLAVDRPARPDIKPWNQDWNPATYEAMWKELVDKWLVNWTDELPPTPAQDILLVDWQESVPYVNNLVDEHTVDQYRRLIKRELGIRHYCLYPTLRATNFLDEKAKRYKTSELLELERKGPNLDLVSFRDKNKPESEKAFFKYAALPRDDFNNMLEHFVLHKLFSSPSTRQLFDLYKHPVMDDTGKVVVGFLTEYCSGKSLKDNVSGIFKLAHLQQLIRAVGFLNQNLHVWHNRISYENIIIDPQKDKPKITELGSITPYNNKLPADVLLKDVYALVRAIHAHVVRTPEEIEQFDPKLMKSGDRWDVDPRVRLGDDFGASHPAEVCFNFLTQQRQGLPDVWQPSPLREAEMPNITREFAPRPGELPKPNDLASYWLRDPEDKAFQHDPLPKWVRTPHMKLVELQLANGERPAEELLKEIEPPLIPLANTVEMIQFVARVQHSVNLGTPVSERVIKKVEEIANTPGIRIPPLNLPSRKRPRRESDVGNEEKWISSRREKQALNQLMKELREATDLAQKAGEEAEEAAKEAKEATDQLTGLKTMIEAARKVTATSLHVTGPLPRPQPGVAWQI